VPPGGHGAVDEGLERGAEASRGRDLPGVRPGTGPRAVVPGRRAEGSRHVTSIARGRENLVRPHRYAVCPTRGWSGHRAVGVWWPGVDLLRPGAAQP